MGPIFRSRFIFIYLPFHSVLCLTFSKVIKWKFKKKFCGRPGTHALSNHLEISKISWDYSFKRVAEPHCPAAFDAAAGFATLLILIMPINHHSKETRKQITVISLAQIRTWTRGLGLAEKRCTQYPNNFLATKSWHEREKNLQNVDAVSFLKTFDFYIQKFKISRLSQYIFH